MCWQGVWHRGLRQTAQCDASTSTRRASPPGRGKHVELPHEWFVHKPPPLLWQAHCNAPNRENCTSILLGCTLACFTWRVQLWVVCCESCTNPLCLTCAQHCSAHSMSKFGCGAVDLVNSWAPCVNSVKLSSPFYLHGVMRSNALFRHQRRGAISSPYMLCKEAVHITSAGSRCCLSCCWARPTIFYRNQQPFFLVSWCLLVLDLAHYITGGDSALDVGQSGQVAQTEPSI